MKQLDIGQGDLNLLVGMAQAVSLGRDVLLDYFGKVEQVSHKVSAGLVSEADKKSENVIKGYLAKNFPDYEFLGEETYYDQKNLDMNAEHKKPRWILDPLDGTTNYIHQLPIWCISLGLEMNKEIKAAIIDVPLLNQTFFAIRGAGAYEGKLQDLVSLNPERSFEFKQLAVSETQNKNDYFLATGFVNEHKHVLDEQLLVFSSVVRKVRGVRRAGAAAYDLAMVAKGVFDGYWERNIQPWDAAAGILLVREAGGVVQTYRGDNYHPYKNSIVSGSASVVGFLQQEISEFIFPESD